jgi:hypothetical protein
MTIHGRGSPLGFNEINNEFGLGTNLAAYKGVRWWLDDGSTGTFSSSNISFDEFYNKRSTSPTFYYSITNNLDQANLRDLAVGAGWNQSATLVVTNSAWLYSSSTAGAALYIGGSFPGGIILYNNAYIAGQGGRGSASASLGDEASAESGGVGIYLDCDCTIVNNGYIAGGGGGGGRGFTSAGGGGAGGGAGGRASYYDNAIIAGGGGGGGLGGSGGNGEVRVAYYFNGKGYETQYVASGGGGGRVFPGVGGIGGVGSSYNGYGRGGEAGGGGGNTEALDDSGGAGGSSNGGGGNSYWGSGGGGGWGASGGQNIQPYYPIYGGAGGAGGRAIQLNGHSSGLQGPGSVYGAVS